MRFDVSQEKVINTEGNLLVFASAGTGKTSTLVEKIRQLLLKGTKPESILCLTFTNRGCEEIKKKIDNNIDHSLVDGVTVKTFHSFCYELINIYRSLNSVSETDTNIFDEDDCKIICSGILEEKNINLNFKDDLEGSIRIISFFKERTLEKIIPGENFKDAVLNEIDHCYSKNANLLNDTFNNYITKNYGIRIGDFVNLVPLETVKALFKDYEDQLSVSHGLDFTDLIYYAKTYLNDDCFRKLITNKYNYIFIDEAQDTSFVEYSLIKSISSNSKVMMSGDFFQTIYEWRGSNPSLILNDFRNTYNPTIVSYNNNYRSTKNIALGTFSLLQRMFPNNVAEVYRDGINAANLADGSKIQIKQCTTTGSEARFIDAQINSSNEKDNCILVRTNTYAKQLSVYLSRINDNRYFLVEDYQYYKRPEVKEILGFLRLIINPYDNVSLERICKKYVRGFGEIKLQKIMSKEVYDTGLRISDLLNINTHYYNGDIYGLLLEKLNQDDVVVFDTETTGLDFEKDEIIQIACRKINKFGKEISRFSCFVKANKSVGESFNVHHISDEELQKSGLEKTEALKSFKKFIGSSLLVGQNVSFDIKMMNSELERAGMSLIYNDFYDTLPIARRYIKGAPNYKLGTLTKLLNLEVVEFHDAMEDVIATTNLLICLVNKYIKKSEPNRIAFTRKYLNLFRPLCESISYFKGELGKHDFESFIDDVVKHLNIEKMNASNKQVLFNVSHFIRISKLFANNNMTNYSCLRNAINVASLSTNDFDVIYKEHNLIPIITVHQAKGCEFSTVYMAGVEDHMYPSFYSNNTEEEERVFYVGATRAKNRLVISYRSEKSNGFGKIYSIDPSPFINYFDKQFIEKM